MNTWQRDILSALEQKGTFKMDYWHDELNADEVGFRFMQSVAQSQPAYTYLDSLGLVNRGFCPINGEKIGRGWNYNSYGRVIYLSEKANVLGAKRKELMSTMLEKAHRMRVESDPELKKREETAKNGDVFWRIISISGALWLTYRIMKPSTVLDYLLAVGLFVLLFYAMKLATFVIRVAIWK